MTPFEQAASSHALSRGAVGTRAMYERDLARWITYCLFENVDPARPTLKAAAAFRDKLKKDQKPLTVRRTIAALSSMYQAALDLEQPLASWNPFRTLPRPPADAYAQTEAISDADAQAIIANAEKAPDGRDAAIVYLLYDTGLRRASVAALERAAVVARSDQTVIRVVVKGGKRREVELTAKALGALEKWLKFSAGSSPWVFPARRTTGHIHPSAINKIITTHAKAVGAVHVHPHRFRAAFATSAIDSGLSIYEVQASLHHADPKTTARYDRGQRGLGVSGAVAKHRARQSEKRQ